MLLSERYSLTFPLWCLTVILVCVSSSIVFASSPQGIPFSPQERFQALAAAKAYAELEYVYEEEVYTGMAFLNGGQDTIADYLDKLKHGAVPGIDAGIDASGLVINAYKSVCPTLQFAYYTPLNEKKLVSDVSSQTLYRWNIQHIEPNQLSPGDLIFFGTSGDKVTGVALYSSKSGNNIRIIVASASKDKVVETGIIFNGDYWKKNVVGVGRLLKW